MKIDTLDKTRSLSSSDNLDAESKGTNTMAPPPFQLQASSLENGSAQENVPAEAQNEGEDGEYVDADLLELTKEETGASGEEQDVAGGEAENTAETSPAMAAPSHEEDAAMPVQAKMASGGPVIQRWGWLKKIGRAIGNGVKAIGQGLKSVGRGIKKVGGALVSGAKKVWDGIKTGAIWAWGKTTTIVKAVAKYGWNVIKSGGALVWTWIRKAPQRIWSIIEHLGTGTADALGWLWRGAKTLFTNPKDLGNWFLDGLKGGSAWIGRMFGKVADLLGTGEIMDFLWQIVKVNTRTMNGTEIAEAQKVFGGSLPYWQIRIDEASIIAKLGAWFQGSSGMGVTLFHTINFNRKISAAAGSPDMEWLIHELTHVAQYEAVGSQYIGEALYAQATAGYSYGGPAALAGKSLSDFNREQQGDIIADYYGNVLYGSTPSTNYDPMIQQLRSGNL